MLPAATVFLVRPADEAHAAPRVQIELFEYFDHGDDADHADPVVGGPGREIPAVQVARHDHVFIRLLAPGQSAMTLSLSASGGFWREQERERHRPGFGQSRHEVGILRGERGRRDGRLPSLEQRHAGVRQSKVRAADGAHQRGHGAEVRRRRGTGESIPTRLAVGIAGIPVIREPLVEAGLE